MLGKAIKVVFVGSLLVAIVGGALFGTGVMGYMKTGVRRAQEAVTDQIPVEFELQRARDMLNDIIPELQGNIRAIAQDEVEVANLKADIKNSSVNLKTQQNQIANLRDKLSNTTTTVAFENGTPVSEERMAESLASKFKHYKEAEMILASKTKLLETRERSLQAALQMFDRAKARKAELEQKVEALVAQHRLIQAQSYTSRTDINGSQLNKADSLLAQIQKRLDVAERVLAHEGEFVGIVEESSVDANAVMAEVDEYFGTDKSDVEVANASHSESE